jgi:hypothetical protein
MSEPATNHSRHASTTSRVGLGIIFLAGLLLGLLISAVVLIWVFLRRSGLESVVWDVVIVFGLIVPCAGFLGFVLWGHPKRPLRGLAIGLSTGIGIAGVSLLGWGVWTGFDPSGMRQGEIDSALGEITSTNREAFYLGDEADGMHLAVVSELDGILEFQYGRCLEPDIEGDCFRPISVISQPTKNWGSRGESADCKRLRPVLGVPAANMGELTVFTGSSIVGISYFKAVPNGFVGVPSREVALVPQLRAVGQPTAAKTLPPPDRETQAFVDQHCGPEPK